VKQNSYVLPHETLAQYAQPMPNKVYLRQPVNWYTRALLCILIYSISLSAHGLRTDQETYRPGKRITVFLNCQTIQKGSWLAVFPKGASNESQQNRKKVHRGKKTVCKAKVRGPKEPGSYEVRQFKDSGYTLVASVPITIVQRENNQSTSNPAGTARATQTKREQLIKRNRQRATVRTVAVSPEFTQACASAKAYDIDAVQMCIEASDPSGPVPRGHAYVLKGHFNCRDVVGRYRKSLELSSTAEEGFSSRIPSCGMIAKVMERKNVRPYWAACIDSKAFNTKTAERCITEFYVGYFGMNFGDGRKILQAAKAHNCQTYQKNFRYGVQAATPNGALPDGFKEFDCSKIPAVQAHLKIKAQQRAACRYFGQAKELNIYQCMKLSQVPMEGRSCKQLKSDYGLLIKATFNEIKQYNFPKECGLLLAMIERNSDSYKEGRRIEVEKVQEQERIAAEQRRAALETEYESYAQLLDRMEPSLDGLEKLVNQEQEYHREQFSNMKARDILEKRRVKRVEYLNKLSKPLRAAISAASARNTLLLINKRYHFIGDWESARADRNIIASYQAQMASINPFNRLASSDYLNAIYWVDVEAMRNMDQAVFADYEKIKPYKSVFDSIAQKFSKSLFKGDSERQRNSQDNLKMMEIVSLLKAALSTYLANYQDRYSSCLKKDHVVHTYFRAATPDKVYYNGYGVEVNRVPGSPEVRKPYKINKEFSDIAALLNIVKSESYGGSALSYFGLSMMGGDKAVSAGKRAERATDDMQESISQMMRTEKCDSDKIHKFELAMRNSFSSYLYQ